MLWLAEEPECELESTPTPSLTSVWKGHREEVEMSWVWICKLMRCPEWRAGTADLLKSLQARTNVLIGSSPKTLRMLSVCWHTHSTVTLDFPRAWKRPHLRITWSVQLPWGIYFTLWCLCMTCQKSTKCRFCRWQMWCNKYSPKFPSFIVAISCTWQK